MTLVVLGGVATAQPPRGIEPEQPRPAAVRGGVLMVPLRATRDGDRWPAALDVELADGRRLRGLIAWVHARAAEPVSAWTEDPRRLSVRPIAAGDDPRQGDGQPYLLARLPNDADGEIRVGRRTLRPRWWSRAAGPAASGEALIRRTGPDRPDPDSPFEHWRWVVLADRLGATPPAADAFDDPARLVATHYADLWRIALDRVERVDPSAAATCADLLTSVCTDRGQPFAAWVADPRQTAALLSALMDEHRTGQEVAADALDWARSQEPLLLWLRSAAGQQVAVAIVNRSPQRVVAHLTWPGAEEIPIAVELPAGVLSTVLVDRPGQAPQAGGTVLEVETSGRRYRLPVGDPFTVAMPPGVFNHALRPPLTLAEVQGGQRRQVPVSHATFVQLRKLGGRWEVFFDCRRPDTAGEVEPGRQEAVWLLLGPASEDAGSSLTLKVPESGAHEIEGDLLGASPLILRRSFSDRWYCRVILPSTWLPRSGEERLHIGCVRTFGGSEGFHAAPGLTTPWRRTAGREAIDLDQWPGWPGGRSD
jgi:hypothetical protein